MPDAQRLLTRLRRIVEARRGLDIVLPCGKPHPLGSVSMLKPSSRGHDASMRLDWCKKCIDRSMIDLARYPRTIVSCHSLVPPAITKSPVPHSAPPSPKHSLRLSPPPYADNSHTTAHPHTSASQPGCPHV
jgi:hypothetical protein